MDRQRGVDCRDRLRNRGNQRQRTGLRSHDERGLAPGEYPVRYVRNESGGILQIDYPGVGDHANDLERLAAAAVDEPPDCVLARPQGPGRALADFDGPTRSVVRSEHAAAGDGDAHRPWIVRAHDAEVRNRPFQDRARVIHAAQRLDERVSLQTQALHYTDRPNRRHALQPAQYLAVDARHVAAIRVSEARELQVGCENAIDREAAVNLHHADEAGE